MFHTRLFRQTFLLFVIINLLFYGCIVFFHSRVRFHTFNYVKNAHHFEADVRVQGHNFSLINALAQFDAQWYLKIAGTGYPDSPKVTEMTNKNIMDGLSYAFFPLYPILISLVHAVIPDLDFAAFILSLLLLSVNFVSLWYCVTKIYSEKTAARTVTLLFLFPFSVFFRSYFSEGLFLLLLVWYSYFLVFRKWNAVFLLQSLLAVTRPTGLFLYPISLFFIWKDLKKQTVSIAHALQLFLLSLFPFAVWILYNHVHTGNPLYWYFMQSAWYRSSGLINTVTSNIVHIMSFPVLAFHSFHSSKVDVLIFLYCGIILYLSRKKLKTELWLISFTFWFFPLLSKDLLSFSRYQTVSFPLFVYLAQALSRRWYFILCTVCIILLLLTGLYFVNWWWVG